MASGIIYVVTALYMSLIVSFIVTVLEVNLGPGLWRHTFRRWGKFLLLLVILGVVIELLS